jgi:uncharacterized protein (DUF58 family)
MNNEQPLLLPAAEEESEELLSSDFLRKLEQLSLVVTRTFAGAMHGERRSTRRGISVEFADFRNYTHGDDLRYVDWNVYARLEKLFLKLYVEEEDLHVHLLIDTSRSMGFGTPGKLRAAQRICAALGYIALCNFDRVSVTAISERLGLRLRDIRGKSNAFTLFSWLKSLKAEGATNFARTLNDYTLLARKPGLTIIISDFLAEGVDDGIRALVGRRFSPTLLQVLAPEEIAPPFTGDLRLVDAETGNVREVTITSGLLARYQQRLQAHRDFLEGLGNRYGVNTVSTVTSEPFDQLVLRYLKVRRVLH